MQPDPNTGQCLLEDHTWEARHIARVLLSETVKKLGGQKRIDCEPRSFETLDFFHPNHPVGAVSRSGADVPRLQILTKFS